MRSRIDTPIGPGLLTERDGALVALRLGPVHETIETDGASPLLREAARQIAAYFDRSLDRFDLPLAPRGTAFEDRVWHALLAIPFGETATYGDIARALGENGHAIARAVGRACGSNPIPLVIPCHRVVGTGWRGGFSAPGGVESKRWLLAHEQGQGRLPGFDLAL